jgi:hypothetical protein
VNVDLDKHQQRELTLRQAQRVISSLFGDANLLHITDLKNDPTKVLAFINYVSQFDDNGK